MEESARGICSRPFVGVREGTVVAFVLLDFPPLTHTDTLVLYEIFVDPLERGKGIGTALIEAVERLARSNGYSRVALSPVPLDEATYQEGLTRWYESLGYEVNECGELFKVLP